MNIFYIYIIVGVLLSSVSQILLKLSATQIYKSKFREIINLKVFIAYTILLTVMFVNILGYKNGIGVKELPIIESLGYVFVPILSIFILKEKLDVRTIISIFLIVVGIIIFYS